MAYTRVPKSYFEHMPIQMLGSFIDNKFKEMQALYAVIKKGSNKEMLQEFQERNAELFDARERFMELSVVLKEQIAKTPNFTSTNEKAKTLFGFPIIESESVPEGKMFLLPPGKSLGDQFLEAKKKKQIQDIMGAGIIKPYPNDPDAIAAGPKGKLKCESTFTDCKAVGVYLTKVKNSPGQWEDGRRMLCADCVSVAISTGMATQGGKEATTTYSMPKPKKKLVIADLIPTPAPQPKKVDRILPKRGKRKFGLGGDD